MSQQDWENSVVIDYLADFYEHHKGFIKYMYNDETTHNTDEASSNTHEGVICSSNGLWPFFQARGSPIRSNWKINHFNVISLNSKPENDENLDLKILSESNLGFLNGICLECSSESCDCYTTGDF